MRPLPGRMTHAYEGELVVFMVGMRINRWWRVADWWPAFAAMPGMMRELASDPESGMIGYRFFGFPRTPSVIQYWTSLDKLYGYASDPQARHRPAWTAFNRRARVAGDAVGIWHETFPARAAESVYVNMPPTGLGAATALQPVGPRGETARARLEAARRSGV
ncbi:DUF4188 domain-containing protein [Microbacterium sp. Marseille-Q6965]|uniref:DUF4188 domain-containing protein n=1 Tax=Microbacterium sp. Marseille-Q6965 TaxID=2965072 RepID=UPI0021B7A3F8|nr:DUF4188 domain-containing protein [Microbacterium sp. Marseille-Q6965]